jgi:hypothetical protein
MDEKIIEDKARKNKTRHLSTLNGSQLHYIAKLIMGDEAKDVASSSLTRLVVCCETFWFKELILLVTFALLLWLKES